MLFRFRHHQHQGAPHAHVRLFAGRKEGALGFCGTLTLRTEEWEKLQAILKAGGNSEVQLVQEECISKAASC